MHSTRWRLAVIALLLTSGGLGCQTRTVAPPADRAPAVDAVAIVDQYMAAWNAHAAAGAASHFTDDVVYYDASVGTPQVSRDSALKNIVQAFLTAAPDVRWTRDSTPPIVGADGIAFQWTFTGTNTGPWGDGTKASGKPFTFRGATIIRLRGDKIAYQGDYYDAYGFLKQLGFAQ